MKIFFTVFFACFTLFDALSQINAKIGDDQEQIFPLELNKPDSFSDLVSLGELFSSKEIIGMGEATHGTKEFFETKARVFKFLVMNCGYKVFGIEASYGGCSYINDFVISGKGNIDSVMLNFDFWTWRTEEVKALIGWIKNYNESRPNAEKISFYGFDLQNFYSPIQYLDHFLKTGENIDLELFKTIIRPVTSKTELQLYKEIQQKEGSFRDTLLYVSDLLKNWLMSNKTALESEYSSLQVERLNFCADNFKQAVINTNPENKPFYRDSCMAENILRIQKSENKKMFVWAHNGHVNLTYPAKISALMDLPMGGYLKKKSGERYYAIGFVFNQGSFQAVKGPNSMAGALFKFVFDKKHLYAGLQECTVPVNEKNTFTNALSAPQKDFFIELRSSNNELFLTPLKTYDIGAVFLNYKRSSDEITAKKQFDGLIYIDKTTSATPVKIR